MKSVKALQGIFILNPGLCYFCFFFFSCNLQSALHSNTSKGINIRISVGIGTVARTNEQPSRHSYFTHLWVPVRKKPAQVLKQEQKSTAFWVSGLNHSLLKL